MKRIGFVVILVLFAVNYSHAEEPAKKDISGFIFLQNEILIPEGKKYGGFYLYEKLCSYAQYKHIGAGLDIDYARKPDFLRMQPFVAANYGPAYVLLGYQHLAAGQTIQSHVMTGIWLKKSWKDWSGFIDSRQYWPIDRKSRGFIETWFGLYRHLGPKWFLGGEFNFTHYWQESHNRVFVGGVIGYRMKEKNFTPSLRFGRYWDVQEKGGTRKDWSVQLRFLY